MEQQLTSEEQQLQGAQQSLRQEQGREEVLRRELALGKAGRNEAESELIKARDKARDEARAREAEMASTRASLQDAEAARTALGEILKRQEAELATLTQQVAGISDEPEP